MKPEPCPHCRKPVLFITSECPACHQQNPSRINTEGKAGRLRPLAHPKHKPTYSDDMKSSATRLGVACVIISLATMAITKDHRWTGGFGPSMLLFMVAVVFFTVPGILMLAGRALRGCAITVLIGAGLDIVSRLVSLEDLYSGRTSYAYRNAKALPLLVGILIFGGVFLYAMRLLMLFNRTDRAEACAEKQVMPWE